MRPAQTILRPLYRRIFSGAALYFSKATAGGPGRNGFVTSWGSDAPLELKMIIPRNSGSKGHGQNPEQLFAMGYACASSAPCASPPPARTRGSSQRPRSHPTRPGLNGFALRVELNVEGCSDDTIIAEAHEVSRQRIAKAYAVYRQARHADTRFVQFCPYSCALREGAEVTITKN
ncbi:hypothetical protein V8D89_003192 [Ganoderma adspersum]